MEACVLDARRHPHLGVVWHGHAVAVAALAASEQPVHHRFREVDEEEAEADEQLGERVLGLWGEKGVELAIFFA